MLKLLRFQPYRYEIWYHAPNTLDFGIPLFANEICDSENDAFYASRQRLEKEEYRDYETLKIEKWNKLLGRRVGEYIYSKTNDNFIYYPTLITFKQWVKDKTSITLKIAKLTFIVRFWLFRRLSSPVNFIVGVIVIIYLFMVAPLETTLKLSSDGDEFNNEVNEFLGSIEIPIFCTSLLLYAFIIYEIIKHI